MAKTVISEAARVRMARAVMPELYAWLCAAKRHGTIYYVVQHVSRSGMSRDIILHTIKDGTLCVAWPDSEATIPRDAARYAGSTGGELTRAQFAAYRRHYKDTFGRLSFRYSKRAFVMGGCGMDMVFACIYNLGGVFGLPDLGNTVRRESLTRS